MSPTIAVVHTAVVRYTPGPVGLLIVGPVGPAVGTIDRVTSVAWGK